MEAEVIARLDFVIEQFKVMRDQLGSKIPLNKNQKLMAAELKNVYTQQINLLESIKYGDNAQTKAE